MRKKAISIILIMIFVLNAGTLIASAKTTKKKSGPSITSVVFKSCGKDKKGKQLYTCTAYCTKQKNATKYEFQISSLDIFTADTVIRKTSKPECYFKDNQTKGRLKWHGGKFYVRVRAYVKNGKKYKWTNFSEEVEALTYKKK